MSFAKSFRTCDVVALGTMCLFHCPTCGVICETVHLVLQVKNFACCVKVFEHLGKIFYVRMSEIVHYESRLCKWQLVVVRPSDVCSEVVVGQQFLQLLYGWCGECLGVCIYEQQCVGLRMIYPMALGKHLVAEFYCIILEITFAVTDAVVVVIVVLL